MIVTKSEVIRAVNMMAANYIRHNETSYEKSARISLFIDMMDKYKITQEEFKSQFDAVVSSENRDFPTVMEFLRPILQNRRQIIEQKRKEAEEKEKSEWTEQDLALNRRRLNELLSGFFERTKELKDA